MALSMKRIIMLLAVSALLMLAAALPAFAKNTGTEGGAPVVSGGGGANVVHCNSDRIGGEGAIVFNRNGVGGGGNCKAF
jgi:hypothetical protein